MTFIPFSDKVLIEPIGADTIIKSNTSEMNPEKGRIIAIGTSVNANFLPHPEILESLIRGIGKETVDKAKEMLPIKVGDTIHFLAYGCSTGIGEGGKPYYVVTVSPQTVLGIERHE